MNVVFGKKKVIWKKVCRIVQKNLKSSEELVQSKRFLEMDSQISCKEEKKQIACEIYLVMTVNGFFKCT